MFCISDLYDGNEPGYMVRPEENKKDKNIFGLELECNDYDAWSPFSTLVHNDIIAIPYNEDRYRRHNLYMIGKEDCTAQFEIVMQAERPRNLLLGLRALNSELNPDTVINGQGGIDTSDDSSAHIHINNRYLENQGISYEHLAQIAELLAPALFTMSGRVDNGDSLGWARSSLSQCNILAHPSRRAHILSQKNPRELTINHHHHRYRMVNTPTGHNTTELRIFSNTCSFDYKRIHLFLDTANLLIDLTDKYQDDKILNCYEDIVDDFRKFMTENKRRRQESRKLGMDFFWSDMKTYYNHVKNEGYTPYTMHDARSTLNILQRVEDLYGIQYDGIIDLDNINNEELATFIKNQIGEYEYLLL